MTCKIDVAIYVIKFFDLKLDIQSMIQYWAFAIAPVSPLSPIYENLPFPVPTPPVATFIIVARCVCLNHEET